MSRVRPDVLWLHSQKCRGKKGPPGRPEGPQRHTDNLPEASISPNPSLFLRETPREKARTRERSEKANILKLYRFLYSLARTDLYN